MKHHEKTTADKVREVEGREYLHLSRYDLERLRRSYAFTMGDHSEATVLERRAAACELGRVDAALHQRAAREARETISDVRARMRTRPRESFAAIATAAIAEVRRRNPAAAARMERVHRGLPARPSTKRSAPKTSAPQRQARPAPVPTPPAPVPQHDPQLARTMFEQVGLRRFAPAVIDHGPKLELGALIDDRVAAVLARVPMVPSPSRLPPAEKARLDAAMGLTSTKLAVVDEGNRLVLGAAVPVRSAS